MRIHQSFVVSASLEGRPRRHEEDVASGLLREFAACLERRLAGTSSQP
jgi:hypothetical protein